MFLVIEFFQHTDRFTESMHAFAMVVLYIVLLLPYYFNLILPLAFLVSMLIVLILMIRGNEMIVARTSGISTLSLMKPFLGFSLVLILLSFLLAAFQRRSQNQMLPRHILSETRLLQPTLKFFS